MANLVVGGSGKHIGKTTLVCAIIAALPEYQWVAVKFTTHNHGLADAEIAELQGKKRGDREAKTVSLRKDNIREEIAAGQGTDTARYLAAGAARAFLVAAPASAFSAALTEIQTMLDPNVNLIIESNRILASIEPDICLALHSGVAEPKPSFRITKHRADAWVVGAAAAAWMPSREVPAVPVFRLPDLAHIPDPMLAWLRERLRLASCS